MKIIHELTLDVSRQGVQASVPITQHDTGIHVLLIHLRNGSKEIKLNSSLTATLYLGNDSYEVVTVYTEDGANPNTLECNVTPYMSSNVGELTAQLQIFEGAERVLSAPEFMLVIKEDRASRSNVLGSTPYGAVVAAQQAAETSASVAASAQTAAEGFAQAAEASAQNAASAAENALTVAAEKAAEVAERVAVEKASEAVENVVQKYVSTNASNALVGNVSGEIVAMDDVSPLEHKVAVKLRSKNLIMSITAKGNSNVLNGVVTQAEAQADTENNFKVQYLKSNGEYVTAHKPNVSNIGIISIPFSVKDDDVTTLTFGIGGRAKDTTVNLFVANALPIGTYVASCDITNLTQGSISWKNMQIEKGAVATAYTPYVPDNTQVTVESCGKNMFNIEAFAEALISKYTRCSIEVFEGRRCLKLVGVSGMFKFPIITRPNIVSCNVYTKGYTNSFMSFVLANGVTTYIYPPGTINSWGKIEKEYLSTTITEVQCYCETNSDNAVYIDLDSFMLETGNGVTEYEPYKGETKTTTIDEGAELTSIAPNMTIATDKEGVVIDCSYNRDINIAFERLTQAIISAGGIV